MVILQKKVTALSPASLERFVLRARRAARLKGIANVLVTSSNVVRTLNRQFLGKDKATDVLSFPPAHPLPGKWRSRSSQAGDIAISADIAAQNAARLGHSLAEEVKILALHGILHLAGFDHERDNGRMARKEVELRQKLNLPDTLIERTLRAAGSGKRAQRGRRKSLNLRNHGPDLRSVR